MDLVSACFHRLGFEATYMQLREAAASLKAGAADKHEELVLDSLPFGTDSLDTQMLQQTEIDALAKQFAALDNVSVPSAPVAPKLQL